MTWDWPFPRILWVSFQQSKCQAYGLIYIRESVRSLLQDMTDQQSKRASLRASSASNIEDQLIPILRVLCQRFSSHTLGAIRRN
jgi:hypothetical protein